MKKFSYLLSYLLLLLPLSIYANSPETEKTKVKEIQKKSKTNILRLFNRTDG